MGKNRVMRVVVLGATGNVGTSVLRSLEGEERVESILGLARRRPELRMPKVEWAEADIATDDLVPHFRGADAVVLLSWLIQPSRDLNKLWMINVEGSTRAVDESWPTGGVQTSYYSRQKAEVERRLDYFESQNPDVRVVRMRQALVFKSESAEGQRRLFGGPFFPSFLARPQFIRMVPQIEDLRFQVVHSYDVGEAYRLALLREVSGAFNLAAEPVLDPQEMGRILNATPVPVPARLARAGADISWRLRLQPVSVGWLDMAFNLPIMDTTRASMELGWTPQRAAEDVLLDLLKGLREGGGLDTPPLSPKTSGPLRIRELLTGVGRSEP